MLSHRRYSSLFSLPVRVLRALAFLLFVLPTLLLGSFVCYGQLDVRGLEGLGGSSGVSAVEWSGAWVRLDDGAISVRMTATPRGGWHIYSSDLPSGGPIPTRFEFGGDTLRYRVEGGLRESGEVLSKHDPVWNLTLNQYGTPVVFEQRLRLTDTLGEGGVLVHVLAEYQVCSDNLCDMSEGEFSFVVERGAQGGAVEAGRRVMDSVFSSRGSVGGATVAASSSGGTVIEQDEGKGRAGATSSGGSEWGFFLLTFLAGLAGLLTPCVFPMIPLTVSFFLSKKGRFNAILNAVVFGLSIIIIYTLLGLLVSLSSLGADFIVDLTTHWVTNLIFFLLFIFFAAAFFSVFELRLPSSLSSKTDEQVDKRGGLLGTLFLGLTTVIVSLSCVGPIVGTLLVESVGGSAMKPILGMFAFGLGFSIPFTFFALFPRLLDRLPKSGGWMNSVKIVLGFIVLAFSMKFLLLMDLSLGWNLLSRDIFIALWIGIAVLLGAYLMGWYRFKMDSPMSHVGFFRMLLALGCFTFAIYLLPGLFGAPLTALSGIFPEYRAADYAWNSLPAGSGSSAGSAVMLPAGCGAPLFSEIALPAGLSGYRTLEEAQACAKASGRPLLVEFSGHGCVNCKEMAAKVLADPQVRSRISEGFVFASLYVDDRTPLPEDLRYVSALDGREKNTLGRMNLDHQKRVFSSSGQPQFFVLSSEGEVVAGPLGRELSVDRFLEFLDVGR